MFFGLLKKKNKEEYTSILPPAEDGIHNSSENLEEDCNSSLLISVSSNVGLIRKQNEDNYYVKELGYRTSNNFSATAQVTIGGWNVFAVFDGMGGEAYGNEASRLAATVLHECINSLNYDKHPSINEFVRNYIKLANNRICHMIKEKLCNRSGCTLALIILEDNIVHVFNIGDSRIYHYTSDKMVQITEDQTLAMKKLKANIYTEEEARNSSDVHKITSYLGLDNCGVGVPFFSYVPFEFTDGKLLICSDGLTDMCSDEEIAEVLSEDIGCDAENLVNIALHHGGEDNITCLVFQLIIQEEK